MDIERLRKIAEEAMLPMGNMDADAVVKMLRRQNAFRAAFGPCEALALLEVAERAKELLRVNEEPAGLTMSMVVDSAEFRAFLDGCEARVDAAKSALRSALEALDKREAG